MEFSFGFLIVLILILFPGLIFRRLYFYGEFSKQFNSNHNLVSLLAVSVVPGIINFVIVYMFYDFIIADIDIGEVIDKIKDINNPEYRLTESNDIPLKQLINSNISFIVFLYMSVVLAGSLSGRFIRVSRLDTKLKFLRYKNYWFYLFYGHHTSFKKMKHLKKGKKKHLFTKADILIDSSSGTKLYSGIIVDYELQGNNCKALSKVILQNAKRYENVKGKKILKNIPGNLFVVDCSSIKNINLTFIYEEAKDILKSKLPSLIEIAFGLLTLLLIPVFIFQTEIIKWDIYIKYFELKWYEQIIMFFMVTELLGLFNPFVNSAGKYKYVSWKYLFAKIVLIFFWLVLFWLV